MVYLFDRATGAIAVLALACVLLAIPVLNLAADEKRPNVIFVFTDDHRWDCMGCSGNQLIETPNMDSLARQGVLFRNAFVTLSLCSPSRAAILTGRYNSKNGVVKFGNHKLNQGEVCFPQRLREAGYETAVTGKWHLGNSPDNCGFDYASTCFANGRWQNRKFKIEGESNSRELQGFVEDVAMNQAVRFLQRRDREKPFFLWACTQVPHMDHHHKWPANQTLLKKYDARKTRFPLPKSWQDDLENKPQYLKTARNRAKAQQEYGYDSAEKLRDHIRDYYASVEQLDDSLGILLKEVEEQNLSNNTWIILMGDNGWLLGEHGMTSKVLPYEESIRVPLIIVAPGGRKSATETEIALNIDLAATIYDISGVEKHRNLHGTSLVRYAVENSTDNGIPWRTSFLYEAPVSQLGSEPLMAIRSQRWKYIRTKTAAGRFEELYDLDSDPEELINTAHFIKNEPDLKTFRNELDRELQRISDK